MSFDLTCDTCGFTREVTDEPDTYALAKEHESEHPAHFVFIERVR